MKINLIEFNAHAKDICSVLSKFNESQKKEIINKAIENEYDGEDCSILVDVLSEYFPGYHISVYHEDNNETAPYILMLESWANEFLTVNE